MHKDKLNDLALLNGLIDSIQEGFVVLDKKLRIKKANKWILSKVSEKEAIIDSFCYKTFRNLEKPCANCPVLKTFENSISTKEILFDPLNEKKKVYYEITTTPILNAINEVDFVIESYNDISHLMQYEAMLIESKEKYKALYDNAPLAYQSLNENGCIIDVNPAWLNTLDYEREEVIGKWFGSFLHSDFVEHFRLNFPAFKQRGYINDVQFCMLKKDRSEIFVSFEGGIGYNTDGSFKQTYCTFKDITEQKHAEKLLNESKNKLEKLFFVAPTGIGQIKDRVILDVNTKIVEMTGYEPDELIGQSALILYPNKEEFDFVGKEKYAQIEKNGTGTIETKWKKKNGEIIDVLLASSAIDLTDRSKGSIFTALDITQRKRFEEQLKENNENLFKAKEIAQENEKKLRETEQRYRKMFENMNSGVAIYRPIDEGQNFIFVELNKSAEKITNASKYELIGNTLLDKFPNMGNSPLFNALQIVNETGKDMYLPPFYYKDAKREGWRENYIYKLSTGEIVTIFKDITERKNAEIETALNNERLESLLKISQFKTDSIQELLDYALDEAIKLTNSKIGYIYFYNEDKRQFVLNSWSKEVMKECKVMDPTTMYDLDKTGCWGEAVRQRKPIVLNDYQAENILKKGTPKGHVVLTKFLTIPVIFDNKIVAVDGFARQESDYNNSDVRQLTLLMDSVWKISERITLIEDLIAAKEKAEEANRLKTEFLNNMSHEIRTPMNGIIGFSEMMDNPGLSAEKRLFFSKIVQNSSHQLLRIIDDILEISNLETKQEKLNESEFNLNEMLWELFSILNLKAKERNIPVYIKKALPDEQSYIVSDKVKLSRILGNLLENALKFTNEGIIELGYYIEESTLISYVKDTGIGISPKDQKLIFERFSQVDKEISRIQGGLGLGLSISKENAQLLGGDIRVESEKGRGSTFYLSIPYKPVQIRKLDSLEQVSIKPNAKKKYTVLIAEDEDMNYMFIEALLNEQMDGNYALIHAQNGREAVEYCMENNDIDLILMDIKMPEMNGHEAAKQIKAAFPDLPIIAQTAYSSLEDKELALKNGCDDFISKPIHKENLMNLINKYLNVK